MSKKGTHFIPADLERKIISLATSSGYSVTPSMGKSPQRKEIELRKGLGSRSEKVYISRSVGISKDQLQVVISSKAFKNCNDSLAALEGVTPSVNLQNKGQVLQSSNFHGFANKGTLGRGEHWGYGYRLVANDGLLTLSNFLKTATHS